MELRRLPADAAPNFIAIRRDSSEERSFGSSAMADSLRMPILIGLAV